MCSLKETLCIRCLKRSVCRYADSFVKLQEEIDKIDKWNIHNVEIKCIEFSIDKNKKDEIF